MRMSDWSSDVGFPDLVEHEHYQTRADENRMRVTPVAPVRGLIYDRNGTLLAQNQPARTEERRVGKECGSTSISRRLTYPHRSNQINLLHNSPSVYTKCQPN